MAGVDPGLLAVVIVAGFFIAWYFAGTVYNRRLAVRVGKELKSAVLALGGTSRIQWFGTAAFRMTTEGANPPFKDVLLTVTLRPREMPINWALDSASHRRDTALVEAGLRSRPALEFEVVDPATRVGRKRSLAKSGWSRITIDSRDLLLDSDQERTARRILEELGPEALAPLGAIHVTAGDSPGIAASVALESGGAARALETVRALADRLGPSGSGSPPAVP